MFRAATIAIAVGASTASISEAQISLWSGESGDVNINNTTGTVTIEAAGVFKFQSVDGNDLADINLIEVADGVTGTVEVHVMRDPGDEVGTTGARDVNEVDLTNDQGASLVGVLGVIDIGGDIGTLGGVTVNDVTGDLAIGGDIRLLFSADDITGDITAGGISARSRRALSAT